MERPKTTTFKIATSLEINLTVDIAKDSEEISVLELDIIKNTIMIQLSDEIRRYRLLDSLQNLDKFKITQISTGSAKTNIIL